MSSPSGIANNHIDASQGGNFRVPLAIVTMLFFMWGFLTCLNDILVPHLKAVFDLNYTQVILVQFTFFTAYFIMSIPSAICYLYIVYYGFIGSKQP